MKADLVIRGGTIVDGSGNPSFTGDVVIEGDRIAAIGKHSGPAAEEIDARGKIVTPGFVDIHTHLDAQITWDPLGSPSNMHGVTSAIVGNCGVGFAPCRPKDRDYLMFLMEGVEDIPQAAMKAGVEWEWETFSEYLGALSRRPLGINIGAHISHAPLRVFAMGEKGATDAAASDEELAIMRESILDGMRAGALGIASGRTTVHRTPAGDPVPGTFADRRELDTLAGALKDFGAGVFELVTLGAGGEDATGFDRDHEWMVPVALESGRPMSFGLIQCLAYPDVWRDILAKVEEASRQGARLIPQVAARGVGLLMGFGISVSPLWIFPAAAELSTKSVDEQRTALRDPALRAQLLESVKNENGDILGGMATVNHVFCLEGDGIMAYDLQPERSVAAIAKREGKHWGEVMLDFIAETDSKGFFIVPLFNPDLDAVGEMLAHPNTHIGLGDSGAHTSQTCDASYATFVLAYWVRHKGKLTLEQAVRKLSFDPALAWGLHGRGILHRGSYADLNVIDLERLDLELPELRHDFPTGAPHLSQKSVGYDATIVNGKVMMREGQHTGALPGTLLRNERAVD